MTRKKIGVGLLETFGETCDCCAGRGVVIHSEPRLLLPPVVVEVASSVRLALAFRDRSPPALWLAPRTALPDSEHWQGWQDLRDAAVDSAPVWRLAAGELRRADERLWWLAGDWLHAPSSPSSPSRTTSHYSRSSIGTNRRIDRIVIKHSNIIITTLHYLHLEMEQQETYHIQLHYLETLKL